MTPIADMVRRLFEKGVDQEAILLAIEGAEQVMSASISTRHQVDETAEKRRAWDREYRRRTRNVPPDPPDNPPDPPDNRNVPLSKEVSINNNKKERESTRAAVHPTSRGHRLPDDWRPTPQDWVTAEALLGAPALPPELEKFIDHWKQQPGARGVKLDWSAAWRNWIRRAAEYRAGKERNGYRAANTRTTGHDAILAAATRQARKIVGDGEMAGPADEAEFSLGDGVERLRPRGSVSSVGEPAGNHDGGKPSSGGVREGEIIPPDKVVVGLSDRWRRG